MQRCLNALIPGLCGIVLVLAGILRDVEAGELSIMSRLGPIQIELIDLDPSDGLAPNFRWTQDAWTDDVERDIQISTSSGKSDSDFARALAGDLLASVTGAGETRLAGNGGESVIALSLAPSAIAARATGFTSFNLEPSRRYFSDTDNYFGSNYTFEISPKTAVIFSSTATMTFGNNTGVYDIHAMSSSAELTAGVLETERPAGQTGSWYPFVHDGSGVPNSGRSRFSIATTRFDPTTQVPEFFRSRNLSVRFDNVSPDDGVGYFYAEHRAQINTGAVVPEPSLVTFGMAAFVSSALLVRRRHFKPAR